MTKITIGKTNIDLDYPNCRPALDLDFTQEVLDNRITFTRGTTGTRVNRLGLIETVAANRPRYDYDPITKQCKGLLIENSSTNYFPNSIISIPNWAANNIGATTNAGVAPDGTMTATLLTTNTSGTSNQPRVEYGAGTSATIAGITYTFTAFCKAGTVNYVTFGLYELTTGSAINYQVIFNLTGSGSVTYTVGTIGNSSITPYPNGWYRCLMTITLSSGTYSGSGWKIGICNTPNTYYNSNYGDTIYAWGAQVESAPYATSYIPTSGAQVTRGGDLASISGTNFSSWYNQAEGTVISNYIINVPNTSYTNHADFAIFNADTTNRIVGWSNNYRVPLISVIKNNTVIFLPVGNNIEATTYIPVKKAVSLKDRNMKMCANGTVYDVGVITQDYQQLLPNDFTYMYLGAEGIFASALNGTLARFTYYSKALPPNQLQLLTA